METKLGIAVLLLLCPGLDAIYSPYNLKERFTERLFRPLNGISEDVDMKSYVVEKANPGVDRRLQDNMMRYLRKHTVAKTQRDVADLNSRNQAMKMIFRESVDDNLSANDKNSQNVNRRGVVVDNSYFESSGAYKMKAQLQNIISSDVVDDTADDDSSGAYKMKAQWQNIISSDVVDDTADDDSSGAYKMKAQLQNIISSDVVDDTADNDSSSGFDQPLRIITPVIAVRKQIDDRLEAVNKHYAERMIATNVALANDKLYLVKWLSDVKNLRVDVSTDQATSFNQWLQLMHSLDGCCPVVNMSNINQKEALTIMGLSNFFLDVFWPFRYDVNVMNQRLAVSGVKHEYVQEKAQSTKETFFKMISDRQGIKLPFKANEVLYSFDDDEVIDGLNRTGIITISKAYKEARKHVFSEKEKKAIIPLANEALQLINRTHPELYEAFVQMVSCIGFYKLDKSPYIAGTISSAIGVIWLNPYDIDAWSVPFMAEQIVHEFIHNTLFYAELVHGTYVPNADLSKAQPKSAIRRQYRDYDKSLHAAYVSAGLVTFHTRIGQMRRAAELAKSLPDAVIDLNRVNDETGILDESGNGILKFLNDYMSLTRL